MQQCQEVRYIIKGVIILMSLFFMISCGQKQVVIDFSQEQGPEISKEEAWNTINTSGLNIEFPYYREERTSSWITSYDGKRIRKTGYEVKSYKTSLQEILTAPDHEICCLQITKTSEFLIKAMFTDKIKKKAEVEILKTEDRLKAKGIYVALITIGHNDMPK